jgi:hypothetical protein
MQLLGGLKLLTCLSVPAASVGKIYTNPVFLVGLKPVSSIIINWVGNLAFSFAAAIIRCHSVINM